HRAPGHRCESTRQYRRRTSRNASWCLAGWKACKAYASRSTVQRRNEATGRQAADFRLILIDHLEGNGLGTGAGAFGQHGYGHRQVDDLPGSQAQVGLAMQLEARTVSEPQPVVLVLLG